MARNPSIASQSRTLPLAVLFLGLVLAAGFLVSAGSTKMVLFGMAGVILFFVAFLKVELALYLLILSMLLSPEFVVGGAGSGQSLEASRGAVVRVDDLLLMIIGLSWLFRTAVFKDLGLFRKTPLNGPIAFYIGATLLSTLYGALQGRVEIVTGFFYVLKYTEYVIVYFMVANYLQEEGQFKRFFFVTFLTCAIICLYGLAQIPSGERVSAPFEGKVGEPNTMGGYLVFMLAFTSSIFFSELRGRDDRKKLLWGGLSALIFIPLLFTLSRASWLALVPVTALVGFLSGRKGTIVLLFSAALLLAPLVLPESVMERLEYTVGQRQSAHRDQFAIGGVRLDTSTTARVRSWQEGLRDWGKRPVLGYGVTGYKFVDAQYVKTIVETGLVGLVAFFWLVGSVLRMAWQTMRTMEVPRYQAVSVGLVAGTVGLLVHALGANTFIIIRIMEPFWLMTGMVMALSGLGLGEAETADADRR